MYADDRVDDSVDTAASGYDHAPPASRLRRFTELEHLGTSGMGMGEVFAAYDLKLAHHMALKVRRQELSVPSLGS